MKKHGVNVEDVDVVVNTHLHWDHCYNNDLLSKAKICIQKKEMSFAISPTQARFYETHHMGLTPGWLKAYDRIVAVDGDVNLVPGMELATLPGHPQTDTVGTDSAPGDLASLSWGGEEG